MKELVPYKQETIVWEESYVAFMDTVNAIGFSMDNLGKDESGDYDIYGIGIGARDGTKRTIGIQASIHGQERESSYGLREWLRSIKKVIDGDYEPNQRLIALLLERYDMYFIPVLNPWGFDRNTSNNVNDVNLNRNYDVDWDGVTWTGEGTGPFSEAETRISRDAFYNHELHGNELHPRMSFYLDCHAWTGERYGGYFGWRRSPNFHVFKYAFNYVFKMTQLPVEINMSVPSLTSHTSRRYFEQISEGRYSYEYMGGTPESTRSRSLSENVFWYRNMFLFLHGAFYTYQQQRDMFGDEAGDYERLSTIGSPVIQGEVVNFQLQGNESQGAVGVVNFTTEVSEADVDNLNIGTSIDRAESSVDANDIDIASQLDEPGSDVQPGGIDVNTELDKSEAVVIPDGTLIGLDIDEVEAGAADVNDLTIGVSVDETASIVQPGGVLVELSIDEGGDPGLVVPYVKIEESLKFRFTIKEDLKFRTTIKETL